MGKVNSLAMINSSMLEEKMKDEHSYIKVDGMRKETVETSGSGSSSSSMSLEKIFPGRKVL